MSPRLRKLALTAHVSSSVGWLGAVACFLTVSVAGLASQDARTVRAAYITMESIGWFVLVPLAFASFLTGLIQSLGTVWGLFRHYWVVAKLLINVIATIVLLLYMQTLGYFAGVAERAASSSDDVDELKTASPVLHAGAALVLLLTATALAVYKPRGITPHGQRKQRLRSRP